MSCPNCESLMSVKVFENQTILHCTSCGASFFEENGINRITVQDAEELALLKETDEVSGNAKKCMKDSSIMKVMHNENNIPNDVTLLQCPTCKSILVFAEDLVRFKQAQSAKINYFKTWHIPLPSLSAVVVLSFIALIAATFFSNSLFYQGNTIHTSQASDLIKKINASKSGQYVFVSFSTQFPVTSYVIFRDKTKNTVTKKNVNQKPTTLHYVTTGNLTINDEIFYTIVIVDKNGKELWSEERKL